MSKPPPHLPNQWARYGLKLAIAAWGIFAAGLAVNSYDFVPFSVIFLTWLAVDALAIGVCISALRQPRAGAAFLGLVIAGSNLIVILFLLLGQASAVPGL